LYLVCCWSPNYRDREAYLVYKIDHAITDCTIDSNTFFQDLKNKKPLNGIS
jgi:hypothetical protein